MRPVPTTESWEALSELKKTYRLGVLSNKQEPFVKKIIGDIFPGVFDSVHGQVEVSRRSPIRSRSSARSRSSG